jgi:Fe-S cluster assembly iron-binding protein IscA
MLTLTEAAGEHLTQVLDNSKAPEQIAVRLVAGENGLAMAADQPKPEDTTFDHNGRTVLVLDQQVAQALDARTLDVEETDKGRTLTLS